MRNRKRYDDKFRASAVVMLEAAGYPDQKGALEQVAKQLSVPRPTLHRWFKGKNNPPPPELVTEKRADLKALIEDEIYGVLANMKDAREFAEYRELGTVFGILVDKLQLLKGKPTEIVDDASLTDEDRASRIASLLERARARRVGRADSDDASR
jgi:transposase-like protein